LLTSSTDLLSFSQKSGFLQAFTVLLRLDSDQPGAKQVEDLFLREHRRGASCLEGGSYFSYGLEHGEQRRIHLPELLWLWELHQLFCYRLSTPCSVCGDQIEVEIHSL